MYVPDGLQTFEGRDGVGELDVDRVLYNLRSQDERRVVLWMVDELRDGVFELQAKWGIFRDMWEDLQQRMNVRV